MKRLLLLPLLLISGIIFSQVTTTLDGSASSDPDGTVIAYRWRQITGSPVTLLTPNSKTTSVTFTVSGIYTFGLIVTDNLGVMSAEDTVKITVNPGNMKPKADAGQDQFITLPSTSFKIFAGIKDELVLYLPKNKQW